MNRKILAMVVGLALAAPTVAATVLSRTETAEYVTVTPFGDATYWCDAAGTGLNLGAACFELQGSDDFVDIFIDDASGLLVGGYYEFLTPQDTPLDARGFCGFIGGLSVPEQAVRLAVAVDGAVFGPLDCLPVSPGPGTTGVIIVDFYEE